MSYKLVDSTSQSHATVATGLLNTLLLFVSVLFEKLGYGVQSGTWRSAAIEERRRASNPTNCSTTLCLVKPPGLMTVVQPVHSLKSHSRRGLLADAHHGHTGSNSSDKNSNTVLSTDVTATAMLPLVHVDVVKPSASPLVNTNSQSDLISDVATSAGDASRWNYRHDVLQNRHQPLGQYFNQRSKSLHSFQQVFVSWSRQAHFNAVSVGHNVEIQIDQVHPMIESDNSTIVGYDSGSMMTRESSERYVRSFIDQVTTLQTCSHS